MSTAGASLAARDRGDYRPLRLAPRAVAFERRADGCLLLRSTQPLGPRPRNLCAYFRHWAETAPERPLLEQRLGPWRPGAAPRPWRTLRYGEAYAACRGIAQALLDRGLGPERPVLILSGNGIEHALLTLAGMMVGVPTTPISPAYALLSADLGKLRYLAELLRPGLVFAEDGREYARALTLLAGLPEAPPELTAVAGAEGPAATPFAELLATRPTAAVEEAWRAVGPDSIAKILLTSGSTGLPKAVPNTHGMLTANQAMLEWALPPDPERPPLVLDWLPWNHTFGGNLVFLSLLREGGTLMIDGGRPLAGAFEETLENLREVSPTQLYNVPSGYALLVQALEEDAGLRQRFFRELRYLFYGGSGLPQSVWDRMQRLALETLGQRLVFMNGFGSTETGPMAALQHWQVEGPGCVGLPLPGVTAKLVPQGERYEIRFKGPMLFPGYVRQPERTAEAFDEEGYFRIGDAGRLVDPERPEEGIRPDGRIVEDFKLMTGTFVAVGPLRLALLSAVPELQDAVVAGHDRPFVAVLAWPNLTACRKLMRRPEATARQAASHPCVLAAVAAALRRHNAAAGGSSLRIGRLLLLGEPPDADAGEITDKGYINQRAVLERRREEVAALYAAAPPATAIDLL